MSLKRPEHGGLPRARTLAWYAVLASAVGACAHEAAPIDDHESSIPVEDAPNGASASAVAPATHTRAAPSSLPAIEQAKPVGASAITYQKDIRPLIETSCIDCHTTGGVGPFSLEGWDAVKAHAAPVVHAVSEGHMPPSGWNEQCQKLHEDRALSKAQRAQFEAWQAAGFPEGSPVDYRAPAPRTKKVLGAPSVVMQASVPYTPPAKADEYRCFILETIPGDTYLTGLQITPQQVAEVHHVIVHRVTSQGLEQARTLDRLDAKPGYLCPGGAGLSSQNMFSYRPGSEAVTFAKGDAAFLEGGSTLIIQVHYNTLFLPAGQQPAPDETKVSLWTLPPGEVPDHVIYRTTTFGPVNIPAGNGHVVSNISRPMRDLSTISTGGLAGLGGLVGFGGKFVAGEVIGMTPHAHQLATHMDASLHRTDGGVTCLDDVAWDFHWQLDYLFEKGVPYGPNDTFKASCTYDNSEANQPIVAGVKQRPKNVSFGERTTDEMCEHYLWLRFTRDAFLAARR